MDGVFINLYFKLLFKINCYSLSLVRFPDVFAKVDSAKIPSSGRLLYIKSRLLRES